MGYGRIERPTPEQWQVAGWMFIVALAGIGIVALWYGVRAPAEKADIAKQLKTMGAASLLLALFAWGLKRGIEWFLD